MLPRFLPDFLVSLRAKLLGLFLLFALIPTVYLFLYSKQIIPDTLDVGLNQKIESALSSGEEFAEKLATKQKEQLVGDLTLMSDNSALSAALAAGDVRSVRRLLQSLRSKIPLEVLAAYDKRGHRLAVVPEQNTLPLNAEERAALNQWDAPRIIEFSTELGIMRGFAPVLHRGQRVGSLAARHPLGSLYYELDPMLEALGSYKSMMAQKEGLADGYIQRLFWVLVLLFLAALVSALLVARTVLVPLRQLGRATEDIASGNLAVSLPQDSRDEIGSLARSFNRMAERLRNAREELRKASRREAWKEAAQAVAHEIKNPLTPMTLSVQDLSDHYKQRRPGFAKRLEEARVSILGEIESLRRLASSFSQFARLPKPKLKNEDLRPTLEYVKRLYDASGSLRVDIPHQGLWTKMDSQQIRQVLVNLVENALGASAGPVEILISAGRLEAGQELSLIKGLGPITWRQAQSSKQARIWLTVRDMGQGIPRRDHSKIFDPHVSMRSGGTGMGLAIVSRIIEEHEMGLGVQSRLRHGTAMHLTWNAFVRKSSL